VPWERELTYPTSERVVIFGVPENMESYLQAVGRGERDGSEVLSILFYNAYHLYHCDPTMRAFVKTKLNEGMWKQFFNEKIQKPSILHKGCDVCGKQCDCGACPKEMLKNYAWTIEIKLPTRKEIKAMQTLLKVLS